MPPDSIPGRHLQTLATEPMGILHLQSCIATVDLEHRIDDIVTD